MLRLTVGCPSSDTKMSWVPMPYRQSSTVPRPTMHNKSLAPGNGSVASHAIKHDKLGVVGMGSCGLDYLAQVAAWPNPDDKLRTESLETQGGGNCANALTAAARLGLCPSIVSKIGDDGIGDQIISELQGNSVDTSHLLRADNMPSPFTYIIVDRAGGTRTCIHTPSAPLAPEELEPRHKDILDGAALVYFDGRLTEAAIPLARAARNAGVPVLVEAERLRPHLEQLLAEADFVTTSAKFPQAWTGEDSIGAAIHAMLQRLPLAKWTFTTLGSKGAVLVQRCPQEDATGEQDLDSILSDLWDALPSHSRSEQGSEPACKCADNVNISEGVVLESPDVYRLKASSNSSDEAGRRAELAAAEEANRNAAGGSAEGYRMHSAGASWQSSSDRAGVGEGPAGVNARVIVSSAAEIPQDQIKDTTGAGDASVGSLLYGLCHKMSLAATMKLAAVVSAAKCTAYGARTALPYLDDIRPDLLGRD